MGLRDRLIEALGGAPKATAREPAPPVPVAVQPLEVGEDVRLGADGVRGKVTRITRAFGSPERRVTMAGEDGNTWVGYEREFERVPDEPGR